MQTEHTNKAILRPSKIKWVILDLEGKTDGKYKEIDPVKDHAARGADAATVKEEEDILSLFNQMEKRRSGK